MTLLHQQKKNRKQKQKTVVGKAQQRPRDRCSGGHADQNAGEGCEEVMWPGLNSASREVASGRQVNERLRL